MWALVPEVVTYGEYTTGRRIATIVTIIPAVLLLLGWFVISKYELSDKKMDEINRAIAANQHCN